MTEARKNELVKDIIEHELKMFLAVNNAGGTSVCQEHPDSFRVMREMTHAVMNEAFLESYLNDLKEAEKAGRNLMTEKYALMGGQIPPLNDDEMLRNIVVVEGTWRRQVAERFPRSVQPEGHQGFCLYLGSELQTYSRKSLMLYEECMNAARKEGRNLVQERYEILMQKLGYGSLEQCEAKLAAQ
ncbi:DUF4125 family protein [Desulfobaculum bizertense]|uniref:DUF4125 domain-containing protein n=1 Tax=Desulfobaculum bizertense DSM 18034 TaxID=1121442 RepID=A0A1T4VQI4_9BACT|nr:DUF4125 family protein [Desulfobaculum bizertense]UIJ38291.1 DUF4125 family protein [Desulfobaculum bizertense]SKA67179.1 Protein of unknown function [Desulfobaculum bizertense DSM 18034]